MASTYTDNFGIEKIGSGEQSGAWGTTTNYNWNIVDRIGSAVAVAVTGTSQNLNIEDASPTSGGSNLEDGMYRVINFTGTPGGTATITLIPSNSKAYFFIKNSTNQSVIMSQGSATVTIAAGFSAAVYCDGSGNVYNALASMSFTDMEISSGLNVAEEDSGTNTVLTPLTLTRTSSGTPAAGIGNGIKMVTETAAANNEIGTIIESITTDVGSGSEDFDIVFKNMAGGSAAAEVARITSTGVTTTAGNFTATGSVNSTAGMASAIEDSGTNTVLDALTVTRTSSSTPATGIGVGIAFVAETAAANNETGATIDAVTTAVGSGAEAFDMTFNLMAGGSAAAEKMRLESTGYLGIGKTDPSVQLHIAKSSVADITALTDGATITPDFSAAQNFSVTLAGNRTLANPTNQVAGQTGSIFVTQDGTGSRTLSYGANWDFPAGTAPTLTTAAAGVDRIDYIVRAAGSIQAIATLAYS